MCRCTEALVGNVIALLIKKIQLPGQRLDVGRGAAVDGEVGARLAHVQQGGKG